MKRWEWDGRAFENCVVFHEAEDKEGQLPVGHLMNMCNAFGITIDGVKYRSSEHLYQCMRFPHQPDWQREIIDQASPQGAKLKAKKDGRRQHHSRPDWDAVRVDVMRWCLRVKLAQHYWHFFVKLLRWTAPRPIVERSRNDRFWGAVKDADGVLRGENRLGRLLVELRDEALALRVAGREAELLRVEPLAIPDFLLLGRPIGVVQCVREPART